MCYFTYRAQKNCIYPDFNLILIIGKIQDGDHCW